MVKTPEETLHVFETRIRQLILAYKDLKEKNASLERLVSEKEEAIAASERVCAQLRKDYADLKLAKMIEISDGELRDAKAVVGGLIREVDKCIALLNV